jgi:hypothetical protein
VIGIEFYDMMNDEPDARKCSEQGFRDKCGVKWCLRAFGFNRYKFIQDKELNKMGEVCGYIS